MAQNDQPKCPECDTAIIFVKDGDKLVPPDNCAKCGFKLSGFEGFKRWLAAAIKSMKPAGEEKPRTGKAPWEW
jgi:hypothetical protein